MSKIGKNAFKNIFLRIFISLVFLIVAFLISLFIYFAAFRSKVYPNVYIGGLPLSGKSCSEIEPYLKNNLTPVSTVALSYQGQSFEIQTKDIDLTYNYLDTAAYACNFGRQGGFFRQAKERLFSIFDKNIFGIALNLDNYKLSKMISIISGQISIDSVNPSITKNGGNLTVDNGVVGKDVDQEKLIDQILNNLSFGNNQTIEIPVKNVGISLTNSQSEEYKKRAEMFLDKTFTLKFEYETTILHDTDIFNLLDPLNGYSDGAISEIVEKQASLIEREPQNPKFTFENGKVTEFKPALDGIKIDGETFLNDIKETLNSLSNSTKSNIDLEIPVITNPPEVTTDKVNDMGIKELVGRGNSTYYHSIPGRVHNVELAASRINGTLVKPGETFSFNKTLGDVSAFTGYQQAYIISEGKTILGDGGGVCQVSSTLFRAVLNAGLPITERQAHAYRVGYYEQGSSPGFDATVYDPSPDFKFTNDTGNYILIEATTDTKNFSLVFELYGTKDGRIADISKPVITNVTAPPADVYQDDPSLPLGTVKQVDYKAWGAKVTFKYTVTRNGEEIINKTFISNYKPWAAVYLRGTGAVN